MSAKNIHKIKLTDLFWDYNFREEELQALLNGDVERVGHVDRYGLYERIITSMGWYQVIDLIPEQKLEEALSEQVITKIRFKDIREKYHFAKRLLFQ